MTPSGHFPCNTRPGNVFFLLSPEFPEKNSPKLPEKIKVDFLSPPLPHSSLPLFVWQQEQKGNAWPHFCGLIADSPDLLPPSTIEPDICVSVLLLHIPSSNWIFTSCILKWAAKYYWARYLCAATAYSLLKLDFYIVYPQMSRQVLLSPISVYCRCIFPPQIACKRRCKVTFWLHLFGFLHRVYLNVFHEYYWVQISVCIFPPGWAWVLKDARSHFGCICLPFSIEYLQMSSTSTIESDIPVCVLLLLLLHTA